MSFVTSSTSSIAQVSQCNSAEEPLRKEIQAILIDAFLEWADSLLFGLEKTRFRRLMKSTEPPCHALANITYAWGVRSLYAQSVMNNSVSTYVHALIGHENQFLTKAISYMQDQTKAQDHYTKMEYIQANILLGLHCFTFGNWPQIDHYVSSAVALSTELRINLHPNQVPTYEIYDFTTQKEHSKLFWCLFELDCCNVAAVQGMSHFFGTKLQISAPDPYNSIPGNGQTYTPDEFLQGSAAKFSSNFGKSLKIAYLTMWSEQLLKGQASFTTSHPDFHSVMAAAIQTQGSLEKLNEYPTEDKVSEVASTQIIAFALFEHLHLYEYMIKTAVPRDQIARIRAWALENIAKIINTVGQSKLKYLKPHAAACIYRCLLFEVHDVIRDLSSNAEDVRKYKLNAMVLLNALSVLSNIYPIASWYKKQIEDRDIAILLQ